MAGPEPITQQGAIPSGSGQQDTAAAGIQITSLLGQRAALDSQISQNLPAALNPVKTTRISSPTLPGSFNFGVQPAKQAAPQGHRDAVRQGVAKTVAGVGNIVGQIIAQKQNEKTRMLSTDIHRVLEAQDAMSQATTQLKGDPNNADAKSVIEKNKQIINDTVGSDPKRLKQFEKAFTLNPLKPEENTDPEHKALASATKTFSDRLMAQTPEKLAPNTAAINKVQVLQQQAATVDSQIKSLMPAYVQQQKDVAAADRVHEQQTHADARTDANNTTRGNIAAATLQQKQKDMQEHWAATQLNSKTRYGVAAMQAKAGMDRTMAQIDGRQKLIDKIQGTKPDQAAALDTKNAKNMEDQLTKAGQSIANLEAIRDKADPSQKDSYDKTIQGLEKQQKFATEWLTQYQIRSNAKAGGGVLDTSASTKGGPDNGRAAATAAVVDDTDDTDNEGDATDPDSDYYK